MVEQKYRSYTAHNFDLAQYFVRFSYAYLHATKADYGVNMQRRGLRRTKRILLAAPHVIQTTAAQTIASTLRRQDSCIRFLRDRGNLLNQWFAVLLNRHRNKRQAVCIASEVGHG